MKLRALKKKSDIISLFVSLVLIANINNAEAWTPPSTKICCGSSVFGAVWINTTANCSDFGPYSAGSSCPDFNNQSNWLEGGAPMTPTTLQGRLRDASNAINFAIE